MEKPNFFSLPREVRDRIYELCLVSPDPLSPWEFNAKREGLTLKLLRASKTVHAEACSMFYGRNRFKFPEFVFYLYTGRTNPKKVDAFLAGIGRNAGYVRHVIINFPQLDQSKPGKLALDGSDLELLAILRRRCPGLRALSTTVASTEIAERRLEENSDRKLQKEALKLVNDHFRSIPSLQQVFLGVRMGTSHDGPLRKEMKRQGWTLSTEEDRRLDETMKYLDDIEKHGPPRRVDNDDDAAWTDDPDDDDWDSEGDPYGTDYDDTYY